MNIIIKAWYEKIDDKVEYWGISHKKWLKLIAFFIIFLSPVLFVWKSLDTDIWFLLNSGRYILNHGFTTTEPFSMHEGLDFCFQQWLTDIYFYKLYVWGGKFALIGVIVVESIGMLFLYFRLCTVVSEGHTAQSMLQTILFSAAASIFMVTRPQITTYMILITEIYVLETWIRKQHEIARLAILPVLSLLEINLHAATWWFLFIFLLPYLCEIKQIKGQRLRADIYPKIPLFITTVIMFFAGFLNPYGVRLVSYLPKSLGSRYTTMIKEMEPAVYNSYPMILIMIVSGILLVRLLRKQDVIKLRYLYLYGGCMLLALMNRRNSVLFAMVAFMICAYEFRNARITHFKIPWFILYAEIIVGVCVLAGKIQPEDRIVQYEKQNGQIIEYLLECSNPGQTKIFTQYGTGALYEYAGFPCYIDARMEVFLKKMNGKADYFDEIAQLEQGTAYYKEIFQKYVFDYYVVKKDSVIYINMSHDSQYQEIMDTGSYVLYR